MTDIVERLRSYIPGEPSHEECVPEVLELAAREIERLRNVSKTAATRIDDHMVRARHLVEDHIEAYGMVPHPDRLKEALAEQSQKSFDLGFRAAGGSTAALSSAKRQETGK